MPRNLRTLLLLIFVGLAIIPIVLLSVASSKISFVAVDDLEKENLRTVAKQVAARVEEFFNVPTRDANLLFKVSAMTEQPREQQKAILLSVLLGNENYQSLSLYDTVTSAQVFVSRAGAQVAISPLDTKELDQHLNGMRFSQLRFDEAINEPLITMNFPVANSQTGKTSHIFQADLRFRSIWNLLAGLNLQHSKIVYVTDASGHVIAHANPSVVLKNIDTDVNRKARGTGLSGQDVVLTVETIVIGDERLNVFVEQPIEDAERTNNSILFSIAMISAAALMLAIILIFYFSKKIIIPIEKLTHSVELVSLGDFPEKLDTSGFGEIGRLASVFNDMVEAIQEANTAKLEFLSTVSHELRTPLTSTRGRWAC